MTERTQTITQTLQDGSEYHLPWMYSYAPGQRFVVEFKKQGKVVRTESWVLVALNKGDVRRWERTDGEERPR